MQPMVALSTEVISKHVRTTSSYIHRCKHGGELLLSRDSLDDL